MLLFSPLLFSFSPPSHQLDDFGCFGAVGGPWELNMSRLGPILLKSLQFSIGTFLQIHLEIHNYNNNNNNLYCTSSKK